MTASRSSCRSVGRASTMPVARSTASQRFSVGLRSGDCGASLSTVEHTRPLSCSRSSSLRWFECCDTAWSFRCGHGQQRYSGRRWTRNDPLPLQVWACCAFRDAPLQTSVGTCDYLSSCFFCLLKPVWSFPCDLWHQQGTITQRSLLLTGCRHRQQTSFPF